jgi:hypothetical protein
MRFTDAGLVWGHGTLLAPAGASSKEDEFDVSEPRFLALLAAAHLRAPTPLGLAHLRKAVESRRRGEDALAEMHLALSRLARLQRPLGDARRLFLAERLLSSGFGAETIFKALDLAPPPSCKISKYNPDEPRVSAGSGRTSGQWTTGSSATAEPPPASSVDRRPPNQALIDGAPKPVEPAPSAEADRPTLATSAVRPTPPSSGDTPSLIPASDVSLAGAAFRPGQSIDIALRGTRFTSPAVIVHGYEARPEGADFDYERYDIPIQYDESVGAGTLVGGAYIEAPPGSTVTLRLDHNGSLIALIANGAQTTAVRLHADVNTGTDFKIGDPERGGISVFAPSAQQAMQDYGNAHILDNPLAIPLLISVGAFDWAVSGQFIEYIAARGAAAATAEGATTLVLADVASPGSPSMPPAGGLLRMRALRAFCGQSDWARTMP